MTEGVKDRATVTAAGEPLAALIDGVILRPAPVQLDERGDLTEIFNPAWGVADDPLVYAYAASVRPGRIKGWVYHRLQTDRLCILNGFLKIVLFDLREDSPTAGQVNELFVSERNRSLLVIPPRVVHAVQNIGTIDAVFVNMPTRPYDHADPDKYRIAADQIPYRFDRGAGW